MLRRPAITADGKPAGNYRDTYDTRGRIYNTALYRGNAGSFADALSLWKKQKEGAG